MTIDVLTTACRRPDVYADTLASFTANLGGIDWAGCRLWLNVDPVGPGDALDVADVARRHFGDVVVNMPAVASFPAAVKWCWSREHTTPFALNLEDDWRLCQPIDVLDLMAFFRDPGLSCVNLRAYRFPPSEQKICLSPGVLRSSHARTMAERMVTNANPEQQLRRETALNPCGGKHEGFRGMQYPAKPVLRDIGRPWLKTSGWRKTEPVTFTEWQHS